jgi:hypothetical protein
MATVSSTDERTPVDRGRWGSDDRSTALADRRRELARALEHERDTEQTLAAIVAASRRSQR